jgi:sulfotransferase family protein
LIDPDYNLLDRTLHRLALQYTPIADVSFDLDQITVRTDPADIVSGRHVFVSGLARAGTTLLMRKFHATGRYRSLTYRDMPFVLAPNLWRRMSQVSRRDIESAERAHGDNVLVDVDSPESLDEVFWRIFAGEEYLETDRLKPHSPDEEMVEKYVRYVNAILSAQETRQDRYLSKNNNNILRLGAIHRAFPHALMLIPFRQPLQQAFSLLRQHRRFSELQGRREFALAYMTWLGHHEFGLDHRPFQFERDAPCPYPADTLNHWLHIWCETYEWLERSKPQTALFVCYEDLCLLPRTWMRLAELADIPAAREVGEAFRLSERSLDGGFDRALADRAAAIHQRLVTNARAALA